MTDRELIPRFAFDGIEIECRRLDVTAEALRISESRLSAGERERAARFIFDRDRRRFTVARARLRELLAARLGISPESVDFAYGSNGKPALGGAHSAELTFNLSHCADLAVYAFAAGTEVGVDVEEVVALPDADAVAARFFSPDEYETYLGLATPARPQGFFNCWTRKEAFIKALGDGLSYPLDRFDVSLTPGEPARLLRIDGSSDEAGYWTMHSFEPHPGYVAAVVHRARQ